MVAGAVDPAAFDQLRGRRLGRLEVLTTIAELTGLPPSVPRLAGLILIVGLFVTLAVALVQRALSGIGKAGVDRRFGPGRRVLIGLMIFLH